MTTKTVVPSHPLKDVAIAFGAALVGVVGVLVWVDLSPRVEPDFFFSPEDPQLRASQEIADRFPTPAQVIIRVEGPDAPSPAYAAHVRGLTDDLGAVDGVLGANSIATDDAGGSPLWRRLLLTPDSNATNIVVRIDETDPRLLMPRIEEAVARAAPDLRIEVSGVPYVIELIRRNLLRDLVVFSAAALAVFGLLVGLVYRHWLIVAGTLTGCILACCVTLLTAQLVGISIGLLTANIAVIVFVLTLSHIVFLTANWQRARAADQGGESVIAAVHMTRWASFWCMVTTFSGFASLLLGSAKPLRELGMAGAIGTVTALLIAYVVFPAFLRAIPAVGRATALPHSTQFGMQFPIRRSTSWLTAIGTVVVVAAFGLPRLSLDPPLLSYFSRQSHIRSGLEAIDRDGGSSPLMVVVSDSAGRRLDTEAGDQRLWALQEAYESDSAVGVVLSPAVLLAHAKQIPLARLLSGRRLFDILESPLFGRIALGFITTDRRQGLFFLRMRESGRVQRRDAIVRRMRDHATQQGFAVDVVGGQYELQAQLGRMLTSSLRIGLGGLLLLFGVIALIVSRSLRVCLAMVACVSTIPLVVLGTFGHARTALDIISSPAASVALAMGVDSMIHLAVRARRLAGTTVGVRQAWRTAREQLWRPIAGASSIICAGFGIFSLSTFPPTQRFGIAVILGTLVAAAIALIALPFAAVGDLHEDQVSG